MIYIKSTGENQHPGRFWDIYRKAQLCVCQFDSDYADFQLQVQGVFQSLQSLLDFWFRQSLSVSRTESGSDRRTISLCEHVWTETDPTFRASVCVSGGADAGAAGGV